MTQITDPVIQQELIYRRLGFGVDQSSISTQSAITPQSAISSLLGVPAQTNLTQPQPAGLTTTQQLDLTKKSHNKAQVAALLRQVRSEEFPAIVVWWLNEMVATTYPLLEKMALLWHGHFATAISKVRLASLMLNQNNTIRANALGNFSTLTNSLAQDPAMMIWLDTVTNTAGKPNENFGRELMERFTIGVGNYQQSDVYNAARAFTGWRFNPNTNAFEVIAARHDNGTKTFLGTTGNLSGQDVIAIILAHPQSSQFIASSLFSTLAYPISQTDPIAIELGSSFAKTKDIAALVGAIANRPEFLTNQTLNGLVKQPVEYLVGAMKALKITLDPNSSKQIMSILSLFGQKPFDPPNVGGWPQNYYWLSTATSQTRASVANILASVGNISTVSDAVPSARADATISLLGISHASSQTRASLTRSSNDPVATVALALCSPEYTCN